MGMGMTTTSTTVAISGAVSATVALPIPSATQTLVAAEDDVGAGTKTIYTVTAGKTFYLMGWAVSNASATGCTLKDSAGTTISQIQISTTQVHANISSSVPIAIYAATTNVQVANTVATSKVSVWGFEE